MFHVYPENDRLRLCLVIDHAAYGFNGKHTGREGRTADKIWRDFEVPVVHSPFWDDIKWRKPSDILCNPEVQEMSAQGLADLLSEIEDETFSLQRLKRHVGVKEVKDIPEDAYDAWAVDLIEAQDRVTAAIEEMARNRQPQLKVDNFEPWLGM